jgi:hypothetical protein
MSRVQCLQQIECLRSTDFANDDPVRPVAERRAQEIGDGHRR